MRAAYGNFFKSGFAVNPSGGSKKFIGLEKQVARGKIKRTSFSLMLQLMSLIPRVVATSESYLRIIDQSFAPLLNS